MKSLIIVFAALFAILQYKLWFEKGGVTDVARLRDAITTQTKQNDQLTASNSVLMAEITDLKSGQVAVEERARNDLGMVKPGETYYQVVAADQESK